ncbi:DNA primase family protein [Solemya velum gill symbiont]|uniref:Phage/plasmid primase n=1 Tax=Solemya velum gill symbiont TaxID=2340 RepID=A0A0B0H9C4_SOVGS|nr:phage/plasmid primase, P4 family [Solemya velum gill symbiont]KHF25252.1 phage/plasmid primase [Solemya velum gill symbiont]OOY50535.1 hypothetical protein BOV97_10900 [Solemya velum gill symbiont]OOY59272.1 hypothetical protein BOW02_10305 [Solemya velum gill symbiont]OOY61010.1 hypothetical protein BOW04_10015 [Solemya velum gill symbiont]OOY64050.1 hypothetical protein BOW05_11015 [Solemya velum gill symbiont]
MLPEKNSAASAANIKIEETQATEQPSDTDITVTDKSSQDNLPDTQASEKKDAIDSPISIPASEPGEVEGTTSTAVESDTDDVPTNQDLIDTALQTIERALDKAPDDSVVVFEGPVIGSMATLRQLSMANYQNCRAKFKKANKAISVLAIDHEVEQFLQQTELPSTHHAFASALIQSQTFDGHAPVSHNGQLYAFDPISGMWKPITVDHLARRAAERFDGRKNCDRTNDYKNIAEHAITLTADPEFFDNAPVGLACPDGFISIQDGQVVTQLLTADHRQRVQIDFTPTEIPTPQFDEFLDETFQSDVPNEKDQQITLLQEVVGALMLGIAHRYQKAIIFYDPFGRAGKGTLERCIRELVPKEYVTAISPFNWGKEYYLASLAGSRLNVVGELTEQDSIPSAAFKTVTGGDLLTGRHPNHRTITFKNEAGHLFMSNHLINTRDHSEAFYTRWLIIEFPNSRLRSGLPIDPSLADNIIKSEMPGIAHWALQGAMRLLDRQAYSGSIAHDRLMAKWRHTANSLEEFIHEECELGDMSLYVKRSDLYSDYSDWCKENGRKPFAKGKVRELLEHNIGLGITHSTLNGYEVFRGVRMKEEPEQTRYNAPQANTGDSDTDVDDFDF